MYRYLKIYPSHETIPSAAGMYLIENMQGQNRLIGPQLGWLLEYKFTAPIPKTYKVHVRVVAYFRS